MKIRITHTFDVTDVTDETLIREAAEALASVMGVQSEDGLYSQGWKEAGEWPREDEDENIYVGALREVDCKVEVDPGFPRTATITATNGIRFLVRLLLEGDRYGLNDCLVWSGEPGVEFYDTRYQHTIFGQFTGGRYYVDTLLGGVGGLCLDGGVSDWSLDSAAMDVVRAWLRTEVAR